MLGESPPALPPGETGGETWRKSGENEDLHHFLSESWLNAAKRQLAASNEPFKQRNHF